jgi:3-oxoacyl-[acyl-carrier protein] reductase
MEVNKIKKILVLGASSDIGMALIKKILPLDYEITAHCNSKVDPLNKIKNKNIKLKIVKIDFKKKNSLDLINRLNGFHIIINLIGYLDGKSYEKSYLNETIESLKINFLIPSLIIKKNLKFMLKEKFGRILNATSIGTKFGGGKNNYNYSLSKHCLEYIPSALRELASKNILTNNVKIGLVNTKIHKTIKKKSAIKKRINKIPIKRMATVDEVANYIYFLSSEKNTYIANTSAEITGGE